MEIALGKWLITALVIGTRVSGILIFAPFFGNLAIPIRIKAALAVMLTVLFYPVFSSRVDAFSAAQWPLLLITELLVGIALGISANLVFEAAQMAGQVVSVQTGFSLVNILDPQTQVDTTVVSVLHQTFAMLIFLSLNVHHWILRAVAHSYDYLPPGHLALNGTFVAALLNAAGGILKVGLQISAPVLAATLVADVLLGLLSKASPQMPLIFLGPAVKGLLGVMLMCAVIRHWPDLFARLFSHSLSLTEQLWQLAR